jgi:predicted RNA-binding protein YlqC (UPF0109 family)
MGIEMERQKMVMLVTAMVFALVDEPEKMSIHAEPGSDNRAVMNITIRTSELGKVIGKQGRTARSLRCIVGAASKKSGLVVSLNIEGLAGISDRELAEKVA